ncbi:MAG: universal stress protein [Chloroflexota bacterium]|nr:MAG: universal stress protein [Chloroflexota bacterium]
MLERILVPLDGSDLAEKALPEALKITVPGGEIILLMAVDPPEYLSYSMYGTQPVPPQATTRSEMDFVTISKDMTAHSLAYLEHVAADLKQAGFQVRQVVEVGPPAETIIKAAAENHADAVVMCTHGRSGLSRWILGSVTNKVLSAASCPVFVIPPHRENA